MYKSFVPQKLIEVKDEIRKKHSKEAIIRLVVKTDSLRALIEHIVSLNPSKLQREATILSEEEILKLAGYIPHNYYRVDLNNIFKLFRMTICEKSVKSLYVNWQYNYTDKESNFFFKNILIEEKMVKEVLDSIGIFDFLHQNLGKQSSELFPSNLGIYLINSEVCKNCIMLKEKAEVFEITTDTSLFKDMEFVFYTFCGKEGYTVQDQTNIIASFKKYDEKLRLLFLQNFMNCFNLKELTSFGTLAAYFKEFFPTKYTYEYKQLVKNKSYETKFNDWLNLFFIRQKFSNDERGEFWSKYRFKDVHYYKRSNSIAMEMNGVVVTEFLGEAAGPIYFYTIETFNDEVRHWFEVYENSDLRSMLYNHSNLYLIRKMHIGNWKLDMHNTVINKRYSELVLNEAINKYGLNNYNF